MKLCLEITAEEIQKWQNDYASACADPDGRCRPRLKERDWIARGITRDIAHALPSDERSCSGHWAVAATLKPLIEETLLEVPKFKAAAAEEKREKAERRGEQDKEIEQQLRPVLEHLHDCARCTVSVNERTMEFSGANFSGQLCELGYNLIQPLIHSGVIYWRGHRPKAPTATVPQQKS